MRESLWRRVLFPNQRPDPPDVPRVLAITGSEWDQTFYRQLRTRIDWDIVIAQSVRDALSLIISEQFPIVLFDRDLPGSDWREVLARIMDISPRTCFLLTSSVSDEFLWREVVMHGGYDVVAKPLEDGVVTQVLQRAWYYRKAEPPPAKPAV
jgi:DNA-binding NtrC family response regulator